MSTDSEKIFDGITEVSDETIEELYRDNTLFTGKNQKKKRRFTVAMSIAAAAVICLSVTGWLIWQHSHNQPGNTAEIAESGDGVTIPMQEVSLSKPRGGEEADMIGFFIYQGNLYVQYDWIYADIDIIGARLGTATGLIDEWTPRDGYVEFAGSVCGDFYEVKGYDPSFMLCMKHQDGSIELYVCNTGITMKYGSELYTDRLHLSGNYVSVQYEGRDSWFLSKGEIYQLETSDVLIRTFIDELNASEFVLLNSVSPEDSSIIFNDMELYHLYFNMQNGTTVHLWLLQDGYVIYQGMMDICVQVKSENYTKLLEVLENHTGAVRVTNQPAGKTLEDCRNDPELGKYLPSYTPDNASVTRTEILYYLDPETAEETGTKEITAEYSIDGSVSKWYAVTVTWASEYGKNGWAGPMVDKADLNEETIPDGNSIGLGIWVGDVSVVLSARGLDPGEVYQVLKSVGAEME